MKTIPIRFDSELYTHFTSYTDSKVANLMHHIWIRSGASPLRRER